MNKYHHFFVTGKLTVLFLVTIGFLVSIGQAQVLPEYHSLQTNFSKQVDLDYLLYLPPNYRPNEAYPLVVYLTGEDCINDINQIRNYGPPKALEMGMDYDYFVVAPQLPGDVHWDPDAVMALVQDIESNYHINTDELYITGIGDRGGWGVYETAASYPNTFTKLAPMGATAMTEICRIGENASTWIFHGAQDSLVPVADAENMQFELSYYCSNDVQLTVFDSLGHNVWNEAYGMDDFWLWFTGTLPNYNSSPAEPEVHHLSTVVNKYFDDNYLLYLPQDYQNDNRDWPLVIFLHGSGSAINNIDDIRHAGPPYLYEHGMDNQFVLLAPQLYDNVHWDVDRLHVLTQEILNNYHIDNSRIYITGLSRGGAGTWEYAVSYPNMFAAVVPISARDIPGVERLADSHVWIFHGGADTGVPYQGAQWMYNRLVAVGADVRLTMYPGVGHDAWTAAYATDSLWTWMLSKQSTYTATDPEEFSPVPSFQLLNNYPNPFNPATTIRYGLPKDSPVNLIIYDLNGREIWHYSESMQPAGWHQVQWNGRNRSDELVSTGVYFYRLQAGNFVDVKKMVFMK